MFFAILPILQFSKIYMMKFLFSFSIVLFSFLTAQSQRLDNSAKGIVYDKETAVDIRLHTFGYALNVDFGKINTYYKTTFYQFGLGELKHFKETNRSSEFGGSTSGSSLTGFSFGKQNSCYVVRAGMGQKIYFTEKAAKNGVGLAVSYAGGATLGLIKPYYLEIAGSTDYSNNIDIKYTPETATDFLDLTKIRGKSNFFTGIGQTTVIPGVHGEVAVHLDWGAFDEFLRAVEAGIMLDVFIKKVPIMITQQNRAYFLNLYASVQFGKRK